MIQSKKQCPKIANLLQKLSNKNKAKKLQSIGITQQIQIQKPIQKTQSFQQYQNKFLQSKQLQKTKTHQLILEIRQKSQIPGIVKKNFFQNIGSGKTPNRITISTWNVNGIRAIMHKKSLSSYLFLHNPDILCVQQTKIDQINFKKQPIFIEGYHDYWNFCKTSAGYSGVAIFTKYQPISKMQDLYEEAHSQQGRVLTLQFQKFYLVGVYVPSAGLFLKRLRYKAKQFQPAFHKHCERLRYSGKAVIIIGDLNTAHKPIDVYKAKHGKNKGRAYYNMPGVTPVQRANFSKFLSMGFVDSFRHYHPQSVQFSWWNVRILGRQKNIGWRLDYILVSKQIIDSVRSVVIRQDTKGSDHCPVQAEFDFSKLNNQTYKKIEQLVNQKDEMISNKKNYNKPYQKYEQQYFNFKQADYEQKEQEQQQKNQEIQMKMLIDNIKTKKRAQQQNQNEYQEEQQCHLQDQDQNEKTNIQFKKINY